MNHPNRKSPNTLFPGHRNVHGEFDYRGPTSGWFSLLHHADDLVEWSDNVMERVHYIVSEKPLKEQAIRLRHIVFLGERGSNYEAKRAPLYADYKAKRAPLYADYEAKRAALDAEILAYIKSNIPDCAWNGKKLVFP